MTCDYPVHGTKGKARELSPGLKHIIIMNCCMYETELYQQKLSQLKLNLASKGQYPNIPAICPKGFGGGNQSGCV